VGTPSTVAGASHHHEDFPTVAEILEQGTETKRWKDVRFCISKLWEKIEGHMTFYLESK
jgi:hypothetical protein